MPRMPETADPAVPTRRVQAVCPHDCPDTCALHVTVQGAPGAERVVRVAGDPDHPPTHGVLCTKVSRYAERTYHAERVLTPLKRVGRKGEGRFEPIGWDEALDTIAARLSAIAARGTGEVAVLPLAEPPVVPPPLDGVLDVRPTSLFAGPRVPRNNVGRDPAVIPATEAMRRLIARYQSLGYVPVGDVASGQLEHQGVARRPVRFEEGRCYLVMAVGGDRVEDLDLRVSSPQRRPIVQDTGLDTRPIVRLCAGATGEHPAEVRMYAGAGEWALGVMEIPTPEGVALGDDVQGIERARALEVALEASRRAMEPMRPPLRGAAWGVNTQPFPVRLRAGRCYVLGAAASETLAALDLWLADERGAVLASDTSERERATVFHCARRDGLATASVRVHGGRGEYVFQVFESRGATR